MSFHAVSQSFDMEAGVRSGLSSGISLRVLTSNNDWVEGMLLSRNHGVQLCVLKGKNTPLLLCRNWPLTMQTAFGAHIGNTRSAYSPEEFYSAYRQVPVIGADFFLATTYNFNRLPLSFSLDYKPFAEFVPDRFLRINLWDFGFSIRYHFTSKK